MEQNRYHAYLGTNSMRGSQGIYHISMDKETLEKLDTCCKTEKLSRSEIVRKGIQEQYDRLKK